VRARAGMLVPSDVSPRTAAQTIKPETFDIDPPEGIASSPLSSATERRETLYTQ
jgi:hypothetical protein